MANGLMSGLIFRTPARGKTIPQPVVEPIYSTTPEPPPPADAIPVIPPPPADAIPVIPPPPAQVTPASGLLAGIPIPTPTPPAIDLTTLQPFLQNLLPPAAMGTPATPNPLQPLLDATIQRLNELESAQRSYAGGFGRFGLPGTYAFGPFAAPSQGLSMAGIAPLPAYQPSGGATFGGSSLMPGSLAASPAGGRGTTGGGPGLQGAIAMSPYLRGF